MKSIEVKIKDELKVEVKLSNMTIGVCDDATFELRDTQNNLLNSGTIPSGGTETITAPNGQLNINQTVNALQILSGGTSTLLVKDTASNERGELINGEWIVPADMLVDFEASDTNPEPDTLITFTSLIEQATATQFAWDFGDGNFSELEIPTHQYANEGAYNVRLLAANADNKGGFELKENYIVVEFDLLLLTRNYEDRVDTGGGDVININNIDNEYGIISVDTPSIYEHAILYISRFGGLVKDADNKISKAFDLSSVPNDLEQITGVRQPEFLDGLIKSIGVKNFNLGSTNTNISSQSTGCILWKGVPNHTGGTLVNFLSRDSSLDAFDGLFNFNLIRVDDNKFMIRNHSISDNNSNNRIAQTTEQFNYGQEYEILLKSNSSGSFPSVFVNGIEYSMPEFGSGEGTHKWLGECNFVNSFIHSIFGNAEGTSTEMNLHTKGFAIIDGKQLTLAEAQPIFDAWN